MSITIQSFYQIDYNVKKLINLFNTNGINELNREEIKFQISHLNEYQFYYVLDSVLPRVFSESNSSFSGMNPIWDNLKMFFSISYSEGFDFKVVSGLYPKFQNNFCEKNDTELNIEDKIIECIVEDNLYRNNITQLIRKVISSLKFISNIVNDSSKEYFENAIYGSFENSEEFFGRISVIDLINNKLKNELCEFEYGFKSGDIDSLIDMCNKLKVLYSNTKVKDVKYYMFYPLLSSFESWKKMVLNELATNKNKQSYLTHKLFYIECLNEFKRLTKESYYVNYCSKSGLHIENYTSINVMVDWLDNLSFTIPLSSYKISTDSNILKQLYRELVKEEFVDIELTSEEAFINVLTLDWNSHDSIIQFNFDHPQTKFFLDGIKKNLNINIQLSKIEKSSNIRNNSGEIIASRIRSSYSRSKKTSSIKKEDKIMDIIKSIKKG